MGTGTPLYGDRAPTIGQYVVIAGSALLDNERTLTGTANQIVVTDNGAGSTVVLSTPQDIHTGASPTFADVFVPDGGTFGISGNELLTFNAAGYATFSGCKVGIGTATPQSLQEIYKAGSGTNTPANAHLLLQASDNAAYRWGLRVDTGGSLHFDSNYGAADVTRLTILRSGNVGIGIATSLLGRTHIDQPSTTAAIPVLFLDQGDVSEQCIQFSSDATDRDIHLFTVNVTGAPAMDWLETADVFSLNKGLDITAGAASFNTLELSAAGPTDNLDVSGVNTVFVDTSNNNVTLGGTVGGVDGQILNVLVHDATNDFTIEHNEGTGNQDFVLHAGADEVMNSEYGGWTFVNHGGDHWHDCSHAKHVL